MDFFKIFVLIFLLYLTIGGLVIIGFLFEGMLIALYGENIVTFEQCRLDNGQVMLDEKCEKTTKCWDKSILWLNCEDRRR